MSATQDTLFSSYAAEGDITRLFRVTQTDEENLFSSIDLPSLTKQITSLPVELVPLQQEIPESTLFGTFSSDGVHQPPLSPVSSILSLQEEATQHTLPDDDDVWQHADELPPPTKKVDTWETFGAGRRSGIVVEVNPFVTEQRPTVFDELLRRHINHIYAPNESGIVADEHLFREVRHEFMNFTERSVYLRCQLVENHRCFNGKRKSVSLNLLFRDYVFSLFLPQLLNRTLPLYQWC